MNKVKNPVGRPRMPETLKRYGHTIMLSPLEHERLMYLSRHSKSISEFIRGSLKL